MATYEKWAKVFKSRHQYLDSVPLQFGNAKDAAFNWNGTNLQLLPLTDDQGALHIGDGTTDFDVKIFLSTTAKYVEFDVSDVLVKLEDVDLKLGDNDILQFGDASGGDVYVAWDGSALNILPATDNVGAINIGNGTKDVDVKIFMGTTSEFVLFDNNVPTVDFGADGKGVDLRLYGETAGALVQWDQSEDDLIWTGVARAILGTSGTPLTLTQGSPIVDIYSTCASTHASNSVEPFHMKSTMTGPAGVGGRALFEMTTNVALGGWSNALKAYVEYGASGRTTGLGSAFVAELKLSAGTSSGTYAPLESELVAPSGAVAGSRVSFLYMNATDTAGVINSAAGYLFEIGVGVTDTEGGIFEAEVNTDSMSMTHVLKICIGGTAYYIPLNTAKTF